MTSGPEESIQGKIKCSREFGEAWALGWTSCFTSGRSVIPNLQTNPRSPPTRSWTMLYSSHTLTMESFTFWVSPECEWKCRLRGKAWQDSLGRPRWSPICKPIYVDLPAQHMLPLKFQTDAWRTRILTDLTLGSTKTSGIYKCEILCQWQNPSSCFTHEFVNNSVLNAHRYTVILWKQSFTKLWPFLGFSRLLVKMQVVRPTMAG